MRRGSLGNNFSSIVLAGNLTLTGGGNIVSTANGNIVLLPNGTGITVVGDAGSTSQSLTANDDLFVSGKLEVDGIAYFDGGVYSNAASKLYSTLATDAGAGTSGIMTRTFATEVVTVAKSSSSQESSTISIPAGSIIHGVVCRVNQSIDGTTPPTNFNVFLTTQNAGNHDAILDNIAVTAATTGNIFLASGSGGGDGTYLTPFAATAVNTLTVEMTDGADTPVIVPADSATTFQVRLTVFYSTYTVPTA